MFATTTHSSVTQARATALQPTLLSYFSAVARRVNLIA